LGEESTATETAEVPFLSEKENHPGRKDLRRGERKTQSLSEKGKSSKKTARKKILG